MESAPFVVREIVAVVVCNEIENGTLGQRCRLVDHEPPLFDAGSESVHVSTVGVSSAPGKRSRCTARWRTRQLRPSPMKDHRNAPPAYRISRQDAPRAETRHMMSDCQRRWLGRPQEAAETVIWRSRCAFVVADGTAVVGFRSPPSGVVDRSLSRAVESARGTKWTALFQR